jgi:hypothetical protein
MKNLWLDITGHRGAAALLLGYWLATVAVVPIAWKGGIPVPVVALLLSNSLVWGALVGWWRDHPSGRSYSLAGQMSGSALAGVLIGEITFLVVKGGAADEFIGWLRGWPNFGQWDEVLGFAMAVGVLGALLGLTGGVCSAALSRRPPRAF